MIISITEARLFLFDPSGINGLHSLCWTQRSNGGITGFTNLLLQPLHFEILPAINHRLNGVTSLGKDIVLLGDMDTYWL
jgi:hypothetical protein